MILKVRPAEFTGKRPRLLKPSSLGRLRREVPIIGAQRTFRRDMAVDYSTLGRELLAHLRSSGAFERLAQDAADYMDSKDTAKRRGEKQEDPAPIGRGGIPLSPGHQRELRRIFSRGPLGFVADLVEDPVDAFRLTFTSTLDQNYHDLFDLGGRAARLSLGVSGSFDLRSPAIADSLAQRANQLSGDVSEDVFDRLVTVIAEEFYLQGKSPLEVARALEEEFDWLERDRAELIARTETLGVTEEAQWQTYAASGVEWKRWITTLDGREREWHFDAHGQIKALDEPFEVGPEELMFPGDPEGSPANICNCRCAHQAIVDESQVFNDRSVWDGENDPDEFSKERVQQRQDQEFNERLEEFEGEKRDRPRRRWFEFWKAEDRDYVRDDAGRFSETEGGGEGGEEEAGASSPSGEVAAPAPPKIDDAKYAKGIEEIQAMLPEGTSLGAAISEGSLTDAADAKAAELGAEFFQRYYAENPDEYETVVGDMASAWAHIGGQGPNTIRFAAQDAFGFPQAPVYDSKEERNVSRDEASLRESDGTTAAFAGAMRHEWEETQAALGAEETIVYEGSGSEGPSVEDWIESPEYESWYEQASAEQLTSAYNNLDDDEKEKLVRENYLDKDPERKTGVGMAYEKWTDENFAEIEGVADEYPPRPGDRDLVTEEDRAAANAIGFGGFGPDTTPTYEEVENRAIEKYQEAVKEWEALGREPVARTEEDIGASDNRASQLYQVMKERDAALNDWVARSEKRPQSDTYKRERAEYVEKWGPRAYALSEDGTPYVETALADGFEFDSDAAGESQVMNEWLEGQGGGSEYRETVELDASGDTLFLYRGVNTSTDAYLSGPVESWSAAESEAMKFGGNVMKKAIPKSRVLTYQGAPSWQAEGFGNTEYEFMILPDVPFWLRRAA